MLDCFAESQSIDKVNIKQIANIVKNLGYPIDDVNILVRLYSYKKLYEEAVNVLYMYQMNNDLSEEEIKKIESIRHYLRKNEARIFFKKIPNTLKDDYER